MRPLEHITILDLSRVLACPFASMILAELGATVIKVEQPRSGDETRTFEPFVEREGASESAYYFAVNRSKQSITVNLRSPDGQAVVRDLARGADVLIENFPGRDARPLRARLRVDPDGEREARLCLVHRLRPERAVRAPQGLRHRLPGDGRNHEPDRRARRRASEARAAGGRSDLRAMGRDLDSRCARRPRRDREGQLRRLLDDRRPGGAAHAGGGTVLCARRGAAAARHRAPGPRPVRRLPLLPTAAGSRSPRATSTGFPSARCSGSKRGERAGPRGELGPRAPARGGDGEADRSDREVEPGRARRRLRRRRRSGGADQGGRRGARGPAHAGARHGRAASRTRRSASSRACRCRSSSTAGTIRRSAARRSSASTRKACSRSGSATAASGSRR